MISGLLHFATPIPKGERWLMSVEFVLPKTGLFLDVQKTK